MSTITHKIQDELLRLSIVLDRIGCDYDTTGTPPVLLREIEDKYRLPESYRTFLSACNPASLDLRYANRQVVVLYPPDELSEVQASHRLVMEDMPANWLVIGTRNNQPFFFELREEEGDAPLYCLDEDGDKSKLASSFLHLLKIIRINMEILGPGDDSPLKAEEEYHYGDEDEEEFSQEEEDSFQFILEEYYSELENIDPECADAWAQ